MPMESIGWGRMNLDIPDNIACRIRALARINSSTNIQNLALQLLSSGTDTAFKNIKESGALIKALTTVPLIPKAAAPVAVLPAPAVPAPVTLPKRPVGRPPSKKPVNAPPFTDAEKEKIAEGPDHEPVSSGVRLAFLCNKCGEPFPVSAEEAFRLKNGPKEKRLCPNCKKPKKARP